MQKHSPRFHTTSTQQPHKAPICRACERYCSIFCARSSGGTISRASAVPPTALQSLSPQMCLECTWLPDGISHSTHEGDQMSTRGCTGRALCFRFLWIPSHGGSGLEWEAPSVTEILVEIECSDWVFFFYFFPRLEMFWSHLALVTE